MHVKVRHKGKAIVLVDMMEVGAIFLQMSHLPEKAKMVSCIHLE